jgi:hypothetical protein
MEGRVRVVQEAQKLVFGQTAMPVYRMGKAHELPGDWLNPAVKGYVRQ